MAYIGNTPSQGVRQRYFYTATGGETSLTGADDNGHTLTFTDGAYVDVYLNGLLLVSGTDYNTSTANQISGLTALVNGDTAEIVVYDTFSVFGGEVQGDIDIQNGSLSVSGNLSVTGQAPYMSVANTNLLVNDRLQVANAEASYVSLSGDTMTGNLEIQADLNVDSGTLFVDASENRVGIGTSSPAVGLQVEAGGEPTVRLNSSGLGVTADFKIEFSGGILRTTTNDPLIFKTNNSEAARFNSSGNLAFPNGQGIDFSASAGGGASSSLLDDYEEGTFTPNLVGSSGGEATYAYRDGSYVKIGNQVFINVSLGIASKGTMSGNVRLNSLGFVPVDVLPSTSTEANGVFSVYGNLSSSVSNLTLACVEGSASFPITKHVNSTGTSSLAVADINTTFFLRASISFRTA